MKTDGNGPENPSPVSVTIFDHRKRDRFRNNRERVRERDERDYENGREPVTLTVTHSLVRMHMTLLIFVSR